MPDMGIVRRVRALVEAFVPWFDRAAADREHAEIRIEIARSRAVREHARQEILRGGFTRANGRIAER